MPTHVACVGDSITAGVGASSPNTNYPTQLQGLLGNVTVKNFGHSGATLLSTGDTPYQRTLEYTNATNFVATAGDGAVVDVIIMLGTNDSKPNNWNGGDAGTRADQFATDLAALVDHFATMPIAPGRVSGAAARRAGQHLHDQRPGDPRPDHSDHQPGRSRQGSADHRPQHADDGTDRLLHRRGPPQRRRVHRRGRRDARRACCACPRCRSPARRPARCTRRRTVSLAADASGGATVAITTVEFFAGPMSLGQVTQAPYTLDWSGVGVGMYALTATATDTTGATRDQRPGQHHGGLARAARQRMRMPDGGRGERRRRRSRGAATGALTRRRRPRV